MVEEDCDLRGAKRRRHNGLIPTDADDPAYARRKHAIHSSGLSIPAAQRQQTEIRLARQDFDGISYYAGRCDGRALRHCFNAWRLKWRLKGFRLEKSHAVLRSCKAVAGDFFCALPGTDPHV
jgi:hypothetical protein